MIFISSPFEHTSASFFLLLNSIVLLANGANNQMQSPTDQQPPQNGQLNNTLNSQQQFNSMSRSTNPNQVAFNYGKINSTEFDSFLFCVPNQIIKNPIYANFI